MEKSVNLTAKLALNQLKKNRNRTLWTLAGIALATAMITAVFGFVASGSTFMRDWVGDNDYYLTMYNTTLASLGTGLSLIIIAASVVVISNAFRVSAGERIMQFGILKSVGATKNQITKVIVYEGLFLSLISIPFGIILGLLVNFCGIKITNIFFEDFNKITERIISLDFIIAWWAIVVSIGLAFITVYLSAWIPARKAARRTAIDAIRKTDEIKVNAKQVRSNLLVKKLFKTEGMLASKSMKRSKRNFRATVISLTVSVILFIVVGGFATQLKVMTYVFYPNLEADVVGRYMGYTWENDGTHEYKPINSTFTNQITEKLREYPNATVIGAGSDGGSHTAVLPNEMLTAQMKELLASNGSNGMVHVNLVVADSLTYSSLCKKANVPVGSNILINHYRSFQHGGQAVFVPIVFDEAQTLRITNYKDDTEFDLPLHGELTTQRDDIPSEIRFHADGEAISVVIPQSDNVIVYDWFAKTSDASGFAALTVETLNEYFRLPQSNSNMIKILNIEEEEKATKSIGQLIMIFIYGFITMLTLIGLTNIISTISTNIRARTREFAILRSVGMTQSGIRRMLNLESILCSVKALVYGIPLGIIGTYLSYNAILSPVEYDFVIPWISIIQCVIGVFVITWATMQYAAVRLRGVNIVEAIKSEVV